MVSAIDAARSRRRNSNRGRTTAARRLPFRVRDAHWCAIDNESKGKGMSRRVAALVLAGIAFVAGHAYAQEANSGSGLVEVTYMPAGAAFFTSKGDSPSFGNYGFGTAAAFK